MLLCFGKSEINTSIFFYFFLLKCFLKKCNGIRFLRNDDRSEVKCVCNEIKRSKFTLLYVINLFNIYGNKMLFMQFSLF